METLFPIFTFVLGSLFLVALLVFARIWRRNRKRVLWDDALKQISSASYEDRTITLAEIGGLLGISPRSALRLIKELESANLLRSRGRVLELTENGRRRGLKILRSHRLLERYLFDEAQLPLDQLHDEAERAEHSLSASDMDVLADHLGHPQTDPHGDVIPTSRSRFAPQDRTSLTDWPCNRPAVVVHIEDEPRQALQEAIRAGLQPGTVLRVINRSAESITCETSGRRFSLAPAVAAKVDVRAAVDAEETTEAFATLAELPLGQEAEVMALSERCTGLRRRRLLDLGFTQGAQVRAVLSNVGDEAHAYSIRDTMIALRDDDAAQVLIRPLNAQNATTEHNEPVTP